MSFAAFAPLFGTLVRSQRSVSLSHGWRRRDDAANGLNVASDDPRVEAKRRAIAATGGECLSRDGDVGVKDPQELARDRRVAANGMEHSANGLSIATNGLPSAASDMSVAALSVSLAPLDVSSAASGLSFAAKRRA